MTDMVTRVARAIQQASFRMIRPSWDGLDGSEKEIWRIRARAALDVICEKIAAVALDRGDAELGEIIIAALREPNKEEKESGE